MKPRNRPLIGSPTRYTDSELDLAILEDRTLYSGTPIPVDIDVAEDAGNTLVDLKDLLSVDAPTFEALEVEIQANSNPQLFELLQVNSNGELEVDYAADKHGSAEIMITARSNDNSIDEKIQVDIDVESINDAPRFLGFENNVVRDLEGNQTIIDLFAAFEDAEDRDTELRFEVVDNSNQGLFQSISIDHTTGELVLEHAENEYGVADLHVVASDRGGLSAGWGTDDDFAIYDRIRSTYGISETARENANLQELRLWTSWAFFNYQDGTYDYSEFNEAKFRQLLNDPLWADPDVPAVFDIENSYYLNDEAGRDRFGRVLQIANSERPDLDIGIYRILPERSWNAPVSYHRALEDAEKGLNNHYGRQLELHTERYNDWHARNELLRTETISEQYGGGVLADKVDTANPSLYTFYSEYDQPWSRFYGVEFDHDSNVLKVADQSFEEVQSVILAAGNDGHISNGLRQWVAYYVVNANGNEFQLSETPDGPVVDFDHHYSEELYVAAREYTDRMTFNRDVKDWRSYAEENIAEARKIADTVNAWISPSIAGRGSEYHSQDFFRLQLDILRPLADQVTIYESSISRSSNPENDGWWRAVEDFANTLDDPAATFRVTLTEPVVEQIAVLDRRAIAEDTNLVVSPSELQANDLYTTEFTQLEILSAPMHGSLYTLADGRLSYQPTADFHGTDFIEYRLVTGDVISNTTQLTIDVSARNDVPIENDDEVMVETDGETELSGANLMANDVDIDGDPITIVAIQQPEHGTVRLVDGQIFYMPGANFVARDHFSYQISDGQATSGWAQVSIQIVAPNPSNSDDPISGSEDPVPVRSNDTDDPISGNQDPVPVGSNETDDPISANEDPVPVPTNQGDDPVSRNEDPAPTNSNRGDGPLSSNEDPVRATSSIGTEPISRNENRGALTSNVGVGPISRIEDLIAFSANIGVVGPDPLSNKEIEEENEDSAPSGLARSTPSDQEQNEEESDASGVASWKVTAADIEEMQKQSRVSNQSDGDVKLDPE